MYEAIVLKNQNTFKKLFHITNHIERSVQKHLQNVIDVKLWINSDAGHLNNIIGPISGH